MAKIEDIIDTYINKIIGWPGEMLPNLTQREILSTFAFLNGAGATRRGSQGKTFEFRTLAGTKPPLSVQFLFSEGILRLVEFDYWSNAEKESQLLLDELGIPDHLLNFWWRGTEFPSSLKVWPKKGISTGHIFAQTVIVQLNLFPSCTIEFYIQNYQAINDFREFPPQDREEPELP